MSAASKKSKRQKKTVDAQVITSKKKTKREGQTTRRLVKKARGMLTQLNQFKPDIPVHITGVAFGTVHDVRSCLMSLIQQFDPETSNNG